MENNVDGENLTLVECQLVSVLIQRKPKLAPGVRHARRAELLKKRNFSTHPVDRHEHIYIHRCDVRLARQRVESI